MTPESRNTSILAKMLCNKSIVAQQPSFVLTSVWGGMEFCVWSLSQPLNDFPGIYVYVRIIDGVPYAVYVGHSDAVGRRIREHLRDDPQIAAHSQCLHCMEVYEGEWRRRQIEKWLIGALNPPLNITHRTEAAAPPIAAIIPDRWAPPRSLWALLAR